MSRRPAALRIFESELAAITAEARSFEDLETGGGLFGLWSHGGAPTVFLATRPGPAAIHGRVFFQQDPATHTTTERLVWEQMGLQCVGLWHSHHRLPLQHLSRGDILRTVRYARRHRRKRFVDILAVHLDRAVPPKVGLRATLYADAPAARTVPTVIHVLPGTSPLRTALDPARFLQGMSGTLEPADLPASAWALLGVETSLLERAGPEAPEAVSP